MRLAWLRRQLEERVKLASLKSGRDGALILVSRDLSRCAPAGSIAPTLQRALDDWSETEPRLRELADALEAQRAPGTRAFDARTVAAPLPRAHQWADCST